MAPHTILQAQTFRRSVAERVRDAIDRHEHHGSHDTSSEASRVLSSSTNQQQQDQNHDPKIQIESDIIYDSNSGHGKVTVRGTWTSLIHDTQTPPMESWIQTNLGGVETLRDGLQKEGFGLQQLTLLVHGRGTGSMESQSQEDTLKAGRTIWILILFLVAANLLALFVGIWVARWPLFSSMNGRGCPAENDFHLLDYTTAISSLQNRIFYPYPERKGYDLSLLLCCGDHKDDTLSTWDRQEMERCGLLPSPVAAAAASAAAAFLRQQNRGRTNSGIYTFIPNNTAEEDRQYLPGEQEKVDSSVGGDSHDVNDETEIEFLDQHSDEESMTLWREQDGDIEIGAGFQSNRWGVDAQRSMVDQEELVRLASGLAPFQFEVSEDDTSSMASVDVSVGT
eukprot:CAMPEP_0172462192 /NCGR_PEP_ID=MMETSP1065-20121228/43067_1 /TAXON_ID=265537 /ORGANISM="Amphiprora paludosa, Strain CCMP125" /LENGTH=393 /DNA_ID=CAMNT_0013217781 /DNA_START=234 /DNA_END=1415 /DNA_ORIENTATION=-